MLNGKILKYGLNASFKLMKMFYLEYAVLFMGKRGIGGGGEREIERLEGVGGGRR